MVCRTRSMNFGHYLWPGTLAGAIRRPSGITRWTGPPTTPPPPHQREAEDPGHQHGVEQLATSHLAIGDRGGTAAHRRQAERRGDQGHHAGIEEVAPPRRRDRPEAPEQRADECERRDDAAVQRATPETDRAARLNAARAGQSHP